MMTLRSLMIVAMSLVAWSAFSATPIQSRVIYGEDDRLDYFEVGDNTLMEIARSTAAMMYSDALRTRGSVTEITSTNLERAYNLCQEEPFGEQPVAAECSGFLVGPRTLVTAGHCIRSKSACRRSRFVFDYKTQTPGQVKYKVASSSVYKCKKLVRSVLSHHDGNDYAVIELDRPVYDRKPLSFRKKGKIADGSDLFIIGYPWGLPMKIAAGAYVMHNRNPIYFSANLDSYQGNSGSAVFNAKTGEIEGILVRGAQDLVSRGGCNLSNVCTKSTCEGEDVTRITAVAEIMQL